MRRVRQTTGLARPCPFERETRQHAATSRRELGALAATTSFRRCSARSHAPEGERLPRSLVQRRLRLATCARGHGPARLAQKRVGAAKPHTQIGVSLSPWVEAHGRASRNRRRSTGRTSLLGKCDRMAAVAPCLRYVKWCRTCAHVYGFPCQLCRASSDRSLVAPAARGSHNRGCRPHGRFQLLASPSPWNSNRQCSFPDGFPSCACSSWARPAMSSCCWC